ncbi:protein CBFA2T3 isoform X2 [Pyxicephalus adspersus]|uniref:protein CBFA2T3 isoform X2 n=1 Tax=Pyxicephalus adspersus TaxID=30357 RepID=UPI003B59B1D5
MPDSPADVKTQTRTTPPTMPPPSPALSQGTNRTSSYTPSTIMNGSSHSPTAINGAPSTPNGFSNGPSASSSAALTNQQLPPACGARQLSKLKRFLTTLQQFGSDISPEIGERVRALVLGLVNSTLTIEEFHSKLQEATNFPLRPFVIPFLKANLPLLQRELLHCARLAKQSPAQYLAQHEQLLLDTSVSSSPSDSSDQLLLEVNENGKRRTPDRTKENAQEGLHPDHLAKRPCTTSPAQRYSPSNGLLHPPTNGLPHHTPPPTQHYRLEDMVLAHHYRHTDPRELRDRHRQAELISDVGVRERNHSTFGDAGNPTLQKMQTRRTTGGCSPGTRERKETQTAGELAVHEVIDHRLTEREWAEEWKHLNNLLNCILDMVEKTRRSLTVLRRCQEADREELNHWIRRYSDAEDLKKSVSSVTQPARHHNSSSSTESSPAEPSRDFLHRPPAGYMPEEIWRKAGGERSQAAGHVRIAEGCVGSGAQGSRPHHFRESQNGTSTGGGKAASIRGRRLRHQPAGGLKVVGTAAGKQVRPAAAATQRDTVALSANTRTGRNIITYAANPCTTLPVRHQHQPPLLHLQPAPPQVALPLVLEPLPHPFFWIQPHANGDLPR